ncbi:hypothetical protein K7G98_09220 [Saccharothrix sp. MB29]|nr:hypothetical protein [Saccharothrix sp. MB29]
MSAFDAVEIDTPARVATSLRVVEDDCRLAIESLSNCFVERRFDCIRTSPHLTRIPATMRLAIAENVFDCHGRRRTGVGRPARR